MRTRQPSTGGLTILNQVFIVATYLYVVGFAYWAMLGDISSEHVHR
jgi:hypothetical protein